MTFWAIPAYTLIPEERRKYEENLIVMRSGTVSLERVIQFYNEGETMKTKSLGVEIICLS